MVFDLIKVFVPTALAFFIGIGITPLVAHYLYRHKMWKKKAGKIALGGGETPLFNELHKDKEVGTPRMGGIIIWGSLCLTAALLFLLALIFENPLFESLNFLSRSQTWLLFAALLSGALVGLLDDWFEIRGRGSYAAGGLSLRKRLFIVGIIAFFVGWWFYDKLDVVTVGILFGPDLYVGVFFIPLFVFVTLCLYAGGIIDGLDGLAGGVFATAFAAYAAIAFNQAQYDLAAAGGAIAGAILAFLWFNIPPARFYMSETGSMALTIALSVIAFMTDALGEGHGVLVLPIIAFPLVITVVSVIVQVLSKKIRGKKFFLIAPLHHHFEAIGWPSYKVTMRYWVLSVIFAVIGISVALVA